MNMKTIREVLLTDPDFKMMQTIPLAIENLQKEIALAERRNKSLKNIAAVRPETSFEEMDSEFLFLTHSFWEYLDSEDLSFVRFSAEDLQEV